MTVERLDCIDEAQISKTIGHLMNFLIMIESGETRSSSSLSMLFTMSIKTLAGLCTSLGSADSDSRGSSS